MSATTRTPTDASCSPERLLACLPDAVIVIDATGCVRCANAAVERVLGWEVAERLGTSVLDVVHPDDQQLVLLSLETVGHKETGTAIEVRVARGDGGWAHLEVIGTNLLADPEVEGIVLVARDLTHRRRWEVAGNDGERFRSVVQHSAVITMLLDAEGRIGSASGALTQQLGYDPELVAGCHLTELVRKSDRAYADEMLSQAAMSTGRTSFETVFRHASSDRTLPVKLSVVNLLDDPVVAGLIVTGHDISRLVAAREADRESQRQLAEAQRLARLGSWAWDIKHDVVSWSDELYRVFGITPDTFAASYAGYLERVHPEDRERTHATVSEALATGEPFSFVHRIVRPDGDIRVLRSHGAVETDNTGNPVRMSGAAQDVTDEHAATAALRGAEERSRRILETAHDGVVGIGIDGVVTEWNEAAERMFGWTRPEAVGQPLAELIIPPNQRDAHRRGLERYARVGDGPMIGHTVSVTGLHRDGHHLPLELTIWALDVDDGMQLLAFIRDVSARRAAEEKLSRYAAELAEANDALRAADELKDQFVAVATHELRSPLTSIVGFTSLLRDRWETLGEADKLEALEIVDRQGRRLETIVENLLTVSTIEAGGLESRPRLVALIDSILDVVRATTSGTDVAVTCPPDLLAIADPLQLEQVLTNLVTNALKYGQAPLSIEAAAAGDDVEIRVRDCGPGVPDEFVGRLFDKFTQAGNGSGRRGAGLGLAIVRSLAEAQGGSVRYEPNPPTGSCFVVRLAGSAQASVPVGSHS